MKLTEHQQQARFEARLNRYSVTHRRKVQRVLNGFVRRCAESYEGTGQLPKGILVDALIKDMQRLQRELGQRVIKPFAQETLKDVRELKNDDTGFFNRLFNTWLTSHALERAVLISENQYDDVQKIIMREATRQDVVKSIRKLTGLNRFKADRIARTETGIAASFAQAEGARQASLELGIELEKKWVPALDSRTREDHRRMNSAPWIGMDEKFTVGGERMDRPRDPNASAAQVIHCRCSMITRIKE